MVAIAIALDDPLLAGGEQLLAGGPLLVGKHLPGGPEVLIVEVVSGEANGPGEVSGEVGLPRAGATHDGDAAYLSLEAAIPPDRSGLLIAVRAQAGTSGPPAGRWSPSPGSPDARSCQSWPAGPRPRAGARPGLRPSPGPWFSRISRQPPHSARQPGLK